MSSALLKHLQQERAVMDAFLELLDQEAEALIKSRFDELPLITERKAQLAERITALEQERERRQQAVGFAAGRTGGDAAAAAGGLQQVWQELLVHAAQARDNNHRNGIMIHTHLDFVRRSINFLRAHGQSLYGADGKHQVGLGNGHSLASS
ncbi:flagella synthesis protein FlgN [Collimonas fungivorans]|uniref:Flagellar biosynthesis protein n=1 Tax=Collimonas fungivorans (strain Ter331) TaxID=1005048 RepID=G0AII5_COLFT|nr:flagellar protein FlgN [Collimonas fungivorans]AEK60768.1 Flagellar biosynthesis protein [Collimonas fungivorans Ter331]